MMICADSNIGGWRCEIGDAFLSGRGARRIVVKKQQALYSCGEKDQSVYFIESGSIKVATHSKEGKECILRIQVAGELFGERALLGPCHRLETATAREKGVLWRIHGEDFAQELRDRMLYEELLLHLVGRVAEQERRISDFVMEPSVRRLGKMLILLGDRIGTRTGDGIRISYWISHDEWAGMIGATRPRVSTFLTQFRFLNLIAVTREHHLIIHENRLRRYLGSDRE